MRIKKKIFMCLFALLLFAILLPVGKVYAASPKLSKSKVTLTMGKTVKLKVRGTNKKVKWSTSKKKCATVTQKGVVKAISPGTATIKAKVGKKNLSCKVTVKTPELSQNVIILKMGEKSDKLSVKNVGKEKVVWTSSLPDVAIISGGIVTAVAPGETMITANVGGKKTLTCKVIVENVSAKAKDFSFTLEDDGDCLVEISPVTVSFVLDETSANVNLRVMSYGLDEVVYEQTYKKCEKGKKVSYKISSFNKPGSYYATVQAGEETTKTDLFYVFDQSFAGGNGSTKNPYKIQTLEQLKKIQGRNGKHFIQIADIDFNYNDITSIFGENTPFVGDYEGEGHSFKNFYGTGSIFGYIGEDAMIRNLKLDNCTCTAVYASILAHLNKGIISSCSFTNCVVQGNQDAAIGVVYNDGKIFDCTFEGSVSLKFGSYKTYTNCAAGVAAVNESSGLIRNCKAKVDVAATAPNYPCAAVISGKNYGLIEGCEASGIAGITKTNDFGGKGRCAGIIALNKGIMRNCSYDGNAVELVAENDGGTVN